MKELICSWLQAFLVLMTNSHGRYGAARSIKRQLPFVPPVTSYLRDQSLKIISSGDIQLPKSQQISVRSTLFIRLIGSHPQILLGNVLHAGPPQQLGH